MNTSLVQDFAQRARVLGPYLLLLLPGGSLLAILLWLSCRWRKET